MGNSKKAIISLRKSFIDFAFDKPKKTLVDIIKLQNLTNAEINISNYIPLKKASN